MREQLIAVGRAIKERRKGLGLTLQELARRTELSAGLLSQVENFRTIPSLPVLLRICAALEMSAADLFGLVTRATRAKWVRVRPEEHEVVEREESHGMEYRVVLEAPLTGQGLQVMLMSLVPGASREPVVSNGRELLYVLSGGFAFELGAERVDLSAGDTLFFDGSLPHRPVDITDKDTRLLAFYFLGDGRDAGAKD